jgi:hypothetical protein
MNYRIYYWWKEGWGGNDSGLVSKDIVCDDDQMAIEAADLLVENLSQRERKRVGSGGRVDVYYEFCRVDKIKEI